MSFSTCTRPRATDNMEATSSDSAVCKQQCIAAPARPTPKPKKNRGRRAKSNRCMVRSSTAMLHSMALHPVHVLWVSGQQKGDRGCPLAPLQESKQCSCLSHHLPNSTVCRRSTGLGLQHRPLEAQQALLCTQGHLFILHEGGHLRGSHCTVAQPWSADATALPHP